MKHQNSDKLGLSAKSTKTPWFLRFARNMKTAAAAVVAGIGLLAGSNAAVQAACNPPVYDVCFHKDSGDWTTAGSVEMIVDFHVPSSKAGTTHRIEWWGYQWYDYGTRFGLAWGKNQYPHIVTLSAGRNELSYDFRFDPDRNREDDPFVYDSYGVSIYEYNPNTRKDIKWVASSDLRPRQAAAYVSVDSEYYSDLSIYYCSIDYEPNKTTPA